MDSAHFVCRSKLVVCRCDSHAHAVRSNLGSFSTTSKGFQLPPSACQNQTPEAAAWGWELGKNTPSCWRGRIVLCKSSCKTTLLISNNPQSNTIILGHGYTFWCLNPPQVKKCILSAVLSRLQTLKTKGVKKTRRKHCGARGMQKVVDNWAWPAAGEGYLFPSSRTGGHLKKDAVCHRIVQVRKSFDCSLIDTTQVRSHSGRHRMINDMKSCSIPMEAGMQFARIRDKKTWASYGQLTPSQCSTVLEKNKTLKGTLKKMYRQWFTIRTCIAAQQRKKPNSANCNDQSNLPGINSSHEYPSNSIYVK